MLLERIHLTEFRSYHTLELHFPAAGLVLTGHNASGKSSLLEAVRMLSILRSPRATHDRDVINWTSGRELGVAPYSRIVGNASTSDGMVVVELGLQRSNEATGPLRKQIKINQQPRRILDSVGSVRTVLFTPDDLELVTGPPSGRRRFMDLLIGQIDRRYIAQLSSYSRVVEQRNSLLKSFAKGNVNRTAAIEQLGFWDEQLANHGAYISAARRITIGRVCDAFSRRSMLFESTAALSALYQPNLGIDFLAAARPDDHWEQVLAVAIREFQTQVKTRRDDELRRGVTLIGPHRDDLELQIEDRSLAQFGSRGQQRLGVVSLKLAEADVVAQEGDRPILLLDDILSELDATHRTLLIQTVMDFGSQLMITSADPAQVLDPVMTALGRVVVRKGGVNVV